MSKLVVFGAPNYKYMMTTMDNLGKELNRREIPFTVDKKKYILKTPNVEVRFFHDPQKLYTDGLRPDAIYGKDEIYDRLARIFPSVRKSDCCLSTYIARVEEVAKMADENSITELTVEEVTDAINAALADCVKRSELTSITREVEYIRKDVEMTENLYYNIKNNGHIRIGHVPDIKNVIFNPPATIVLWSDGTKTIVKCQNGDEYDPEKGLAMAISKKACGNTREYYEIFNKHVGRYYKKKERK